MLIALRAGPGVAHSGTLAARRRKPTVLGADPALSAGLGLTRQWLHAHRLELPHPVTGEPVSIVSEYPDDLAHALGALRGEV